MGAAQKKEVEAKSGGKEAAAAPSKAAMAVSNGVEKVSDEMGSPQISARTCTSVLSSLLASCLERHPSLFILVCGVNAVTNLPSDA